ncbi:hypothetical protein QJS10_CPA06g00060 [Acorus calamus]|uniref:Reverse transcriptase zinc-binding domain-containing protein n=1 Tax=Acorus calamus TaxID=4465 RepID=A0AAV9EKD1_ACOCL|nr:hypothetical protein QJS10_CPA06g00060 [Acorus calamus]
MVLRTGRGTEHDHNSGGATKWTTNIISLPIQTLLIEKSRGGLEGGGSLPTPKCANWQLCLSRFSATTRRRRGQTLLAGRRDLTQATQSKVGINGGVKTYRWCKRRLLRKAYKGKWRGVEDQNCSLCNNEVETVEHLFLTCPKAVQFWTWLAHLASIRTNSQDLGKLWDAMGNSANRGDKSIKARMMRIKVQFFLYVPKSKGAAGF